MATYRATFDYEKQAREHAGQVEIDTLKDGIAPGGLKAGDIVVFRFRTGALTKADGTPDDATKRGNFQVTQPQRPGAEATLTGTFNGAHTKSDRQSFSWSFNSVPLTPNTEYEVTVAVDDDTPGIRGKLTAIASGHKTAR